MKNVKTAMKQEWEQRAQENAYHWVVSEETDWNKDAYYQRGKDHIATYVQPFWKEKGFTTNEITQFHVLDIGCGTGRLSRALSEHVAKVTGIDISETMLQKAKQDNADRANIEFLQTDGTNFAQVATNSIDFIFSLIVFQHIPSQIVVEGYFSEMNRVLKPGACAKIQVRGTPGNPPGKVLWFHGFRSFYIAFCLWRNKIPMLWARRYNTVYGACFTPMQLKTKLQKAGFNQVNVYYEKNNPQHLWAEVQATT